MTITIFLKCIAFVHGVKDNNICVLFNFLSWFLNLCIGYLHTYLYIRVSDDGHVGKCELKLCSVQCLRNKIALYTQ